MKPYDLVVVGAGLAGTVVAERAARQLGWRVAVVEQRDHVAGNASDAVDEHGVLVHRYGPHVFHSNCEPVWCYLSRFARWLPYRHKVMARMNGGLVPLPINFNSIDRLFPPRHAGPLQRSLITQYGAGAEVPILTLRQSEHPEIRRFATQLYEEVYLGYTIKQWGLSPEELDASVTGRVPVRMSRNDNYFTDSYEALPADGYTSMVLRMLAHPRIETVVGVDYHLHAEDFPGRRLLYTGPIDRYFDYKHGELPYRTLKLEFRHASRDWVQPTGSITYPMQGKYTRSCEYKHLTRQNVRGTTISFEVPMAHRPEETTPYYPIPLRESRVRYKLYAAEAARLERVVFCGRLGRYQYLNMDQAVAQALHTVERVAAIA